MKRSVLLRFIMPLAAATVLLLSGCAVARDYHVADGVNAKRGYSSISGDITVGADSQIRKARTVSGDIRMGSGSRARKLTSVSGDIWLERDATVDRRISTVSGDIEAGPGCVIGGDLRTVAGSVVLDRSAVEGDIRLTAGDLSLIGSRVDGAIIVEDTSENSDGTRIEIGAGSRVGAVRSGEPERVRLRVHQSATVGDTGGIAVERFGD